MVTKTTCTANEGQDGGETGYNLEGKHAELCWRENHSAGI